MRTSRKHMACILNIGRDAIVLEARAEVLRHAGYEVICCTDEDEALTLAVNAAAVILGTSMPLERKMTISRRLRAVSTAPIICIDGQPFDCNCECESVIHSLDGPKVLLETLARLLPQEAANKF